MRTLWLVFLFFSCGVLQAQAPEIHAAKLPGEPHHHLRIDNEFVRAYYVEVAPHDETQLHQHDHDYIYVSLGAADVVNAVLDKPDVHLVLKDGATRFTPGGFAHVARNLSDAPFRNITIELLKPSGEPRNLCAQIAPNRASVGCDKTTAAAGGGHGFSIEPQLETDAMRLDLVRLEPETESAGVALEADSLLVPLDGSDIQIKIQGEPAENVARGQTGLDRKRIGTAQSGILAKIHLSYLQLTFTSKH